MIANLPKQQTMSDILTQVMNKEPKKNVFDRIDQSKEIKESKLPPVNPKYVLNHKNFVNLINTTDVHASK